MTRKIRLTIEVDLDDLSDAERAECEALEGEVLDEDGHPVGLPRLEDYELDDLAHPIGSDLEGRNDTIWEGSGVYAKITASRIVAMEEIDG